MTGNRGFSIVGVLVGSGIGMFVLGVLTDVMVTQFRYQKHLSQKLEITDFKKALIDTLSKSNNCSCQFTNTGANPNIAKYPVLKFDSTVIDGSQSIPTDNIYSGCLGGPNPPILLASNNQALFGTRDLIVSTVKIVDLRPTGGAATPNDWQGQWEVDFQVGPGSLSQPTPPIRVTQRFLIDPTIPTAARISSCQGASGGIGTENFLAKWSVIPGLLEDSKIFQDPITGLIKVIQGNVYASMDNSWSSIHTHSYSSGSPNHHGAFLGMRARGTIAAPSYPLLDDSLGGFWGRDAIDGTNLLNYGGGGIHFMATENFTVDKKGTKILFATTPNGAALPSNRT